jgi:hypothetical protein
MKSMHARYQTFISLEIRRQPNLTLQSLINDLIQEKTYMKNLNLTTDNMLALYIGKIYLNYKRKLQKNFTSKDGEEISKYGGKKKLSVYIV